MGDVTITSRSLASPTTLILATVLAAVKPWGRIGRRAEGAGHDRRHTGRRAREAR